VSSVALAEVAQELGVGDHVLLGKGEEQSGGRLKPSILADAMEAIIGALYLASGLDATTRFVLGIFGGRLSTAQADAADHKSRLQELCAQRFGLAPRYEVEASGPDHARTFHVVVTIGGTPHGRGEGRSKKQAEQAAARDAVTALVDGSIPVVDATGVDADPADPTNGSDVDDTIREIHHG
jgi:ribonuclease-3